MRFLVSLGLAEPEGFSNHRSCPQRETDRVCQPLRRHLQRFALLEWQAERAVDIRLHSIGWSGARVATRCIIVLSSEPRRPRSTGPLCALSLYKRAGLLQRGQHGTDHCRAFRLDGGLQGPLRKGVYCSQHEPAVLGQNTVQWRHIA